MILSNKTIIITGANRGIGKATLETFAQFGANIFACARKQTPQFLNLIENLKKQYKVKIIPVYFDLENIDEIKDGVKYIKSFKTPIDALVNNAGVILHKLFLMSTVEDIQRQFDINFKSVFVLSQFISRIMIKQGFGSIVNLSSRAAKGDIGEAAYGASKACISSLTRTMAKEFGQYGIRVNAIAPGIIDTDMTKMLSEEVIKNNTDSIFLKRLGTPEEVANVAAFLCSNLSSYITGTIIEVEGGQ